MDNTTNTTVEGKVATPEPPLTINNGTIPTMATSVPQVETAPVTPAAASSSSFVPQQPMIVQQKSNKTVWIILAAVFGVLLLCCCACSAIFMFGDTSSSRSRTNTYRSDY